MASRPSDRNETFRNPTPPQDALFLRQQSLEDDYLMDEAEQASMKGQGIPRHPPGTKMLKASSDDDAAAIRREISRLPHSRVSPPRPNNNGTKPSDSD